MKGANDRDPAGGSFEDEDRVRAFPSPYNGPNNPNKYRTSSGRRLQGENGCAREIGVKMRVGAHGGL